MSTTQVEPPASSTAAARARKAQAAAPLAGARARGAGLVGLVLALVAVSVASLAVGAASVPLEDVFGALFSFDNSDAQVIVHDLRVPRMLIGLAVGASLGAAGAVMQGMTRNPLADPGILGIEAGAAFAVVLAIHLLGVGSVAGYAAFALVGATAAGVALYVLGSSGRSGATPVTLSLAGAALTALLSALTYAIVVFDAQTLDQFRFWIVGALAGRDLEVLYGTLPFMAVGMLLALGSGRALNALSLGEDVARALGQRIGVSRAIGSAGFILLAGGAVAAAGPIAFIGLTVPHVARALVGPDYRWVVPYSAVLGAILILVADVIGRVVAPPGELQVGIVMAFVGAPVFIALVRRRKLAQL